MRSVWFILVFSLFLLLGCGPKAVKIVNPTPPPVCKIKIFEVKKVGGGKWEWREEREEETTSPELRDLKAFVEERLQKEFLRQKIPPIYIEGRMGFLKASFASKFFSGISSFVPRLRGVCALELKVQAPNPKAITAEERCYGIWKRVVFGRLAKKAVKDLDEFLAKGRQ